MSNYRNEKLDKVYKKLPKLNCKGKCVQSCSVIKVSDYERERISKFIGHDPFIEDTKLVDHLKNNPPDKWSCELLKDGRCSVYNKRPLICRLFGLVKKMACPFGCVPDRWLSDSEAKIMMKKAGYFINKGEE